MQISTLLPQSIQNGLGFLDRNCHPVTGLQNNCVGSSRTDLVPTPYPEEIFTSMMALDLLSTSLSPKTVQALHGFIALDSEFGSTNFNKYTTLIPDDVEDTSLLHYVRLRDGLIGDKADRRLVDVLRLIVLNTNADGVIQLYFPPYGARSNRLDPSCLSNAMRILYATGWNSEAGPTETFLYQCLESGRYLNAANSYYPSPDTFLYFVSRAVSLNEGARARFQSLILDHVKARLALGTETETEFSMDRAMRILTLDNLGMLDQSGELGLDKLIRENVEAICGAQENGGAWPKDALFKKGRSDVYFGGNVVPTIFATAALQAFARASVE